MGVQNQVCLQILLAAIWVSRRISGLVVEYIVAIDVTWVRFPADAWLENAQLAECKDTCGLCG